MKNTVVWALWSCYFLEEIVLLYGSILGKMHTAGVCFMDMLLVFLAFSCSFHLLIYCRCCSFGGCSWLKWHYNDDANQRWLYEAIQLNPYSWRLFYGCVIVLGLFPFILLLIYCFCCSFGGSKCLKWCYIGAASQRWLDKASQNLDHKLFCSLTK